MKAMRYSGLLSNAVDEGLSQLGELPKRAVYEALETDFSMPKKDIPTRFSEFSSILLGSIGPSARPLLEYIVDRFSTGLPTRSLSSIDLDESIKRVDMILKGSINLSDDVDHSSRVGAVQLENKAVATTIQASSLSKIPRPKGGRKKVSGTTENPPYAKVNSEA